VEVTRVAYVVHGNPQERELHCTVKNAGPTSASVDVWALHWTAPQVRVRRDVWDAESAETLTWYERAVGELKKRPIADPTSWRFQAARHGYGQASDPLKVAGEKLPTAADRETYWNQCQHSSWYFLPWHRMYLHFFEEIVAAAVKSLGGPSDWALPYWNYGASAAAALLPPAFRKPTLPNGAPNNLFVASRSAAANAGNTIASSQSTSAAAALAANTFFSDSGAATFGGPKTQFNHSGGPVGRLEGTPHGDMHMAVGGWMTSFNTAALDPIFWLHHANIDRLWEVWLAQGGGRANPDSSTGWTNAIAFPFHDAKGNAVTLRPKDVVDTEALGYKYDVDTVQPAALGTPTPRSQMRKPPELAGATMEPLILEGAPAQVRMPTPQRKSRSLAMAPGAPPPRIFLHVENLIADDLASPYEVYLNVPGNDEPAAHPKHFVGTLPMFGLAESSRSDAHHSASGLSYVFDVTELVDRLEAKPGFDRGELRVSFVPTGERRPVPVRVGRVSLFEE
jgi:tyrosinase